MLVTVDPSKRFTYISQLIYHSYKTNFFFFTYKNADNTNIHLTIFSYFNGKTGYNGCHFDFF